MLSTHHGTEPACLKANRFAVKGGARQVLVSSSPIHRKYAASHGNSPSSLRAQSSPHGPGNRDFATDGASGGSGALWVTLRRRGAKEPLEPLLLTILSNWEFVLYLILTRC